MEDEEILKYSMQIAMFKQLLNNKLIVEICLIYLFDVKN